MPKARRSRKSPTSTARAPRAARTAFVPRVIFATVFAGVVPACVAGCSNSVATVAQVGFDANDELRMTVAQVGFDANDAPDAPDVQIISLAQIGFDADAGDASETGPDVIFGVADVGFNG